ncbi:ABC-type transport system [Algibacter lectus]|uniref:ABC-type transport system n=1 Tax=Algibacter lectus TaxID=221126 RepID=A0A090VDA3_9FLAO|nr:ABC-type transport system [Algibacter lectus]
MKQLILKDIDDLIIGSLGIVAFIAFFVGGVVTIQTALNIDNPLIPKYLVGFATRQSIILEFAPTFISIVMAGKVAHLLHRVLVLCELPNKLMLWKLWE